MLVHVVFGSGFPWVAWAFGFVCVVYSWNFCNHIHRQSILLCFPGSNNRPNRVVAHRRKRTPHRNRLSSGCSFVVNQTMKPKNRVKTEVTDTKLKVHCVVILIRPS